MKIERIVNTLDNKDLKNYSTLRNLRFGSY